MIDAIVSLNIQKKIKVHKVNIHQKKLLNTQINMLLDKLMLKKQLLLLCEIVGEGNYYLKIFVNKLLQKIYQFQDQQVLEKLKQLEELLNQLMHHLLELKLQNLHKLDMWVKMSLVSSKISKISLGQVKKLKQDLEKSQTADFQNKILSEIADVMLGKDFANQKIRTSKINDLKQGKYNNFTMTVFPQDFTLTRDSQERKAMQATVQEILFTLIQMHNERQYLDLRQINLQKQAIKRVQENGIVFLDQIDKLANNSMFDRRLSVSRQGVQRDLLPLIQGTTVSTKIGDINTENILFIACGAFSMTKVQDLMPQLLGRLPIRVNMSAITQQQFIRILKQPKYNLLLQQSKMLQQENITLHYTAESIQQIAKYAYDLNMYHQNLGARRLHQVTQKIIEDLSFNSPEYSGQTITIDANYVVQKLKDMSKKMDLNKFLI